MSQLDLTFIEQTFQASLNRPNAPVGRVVTDSRDIRPGDVFFALQGERFDAHDFVDEVLAQGALLCVVSRADCAAKAGCLKVDDTARALAQLAHAWRMSLPGLTVLGITGSSGKTTVKEMAATVLRYSLGEAAVLATAGNFNNHIGLPLTLLRLTPAHRYAVIEMGMNHAGELAELTRIARPDIALVNNALRAHIGCGFNDVSDIARAKSEIYQGLPPHGMALIPAEDAHVTLFQTAAGAYPQRSFGLRQGDVWVDELELAPLSSRFVLHAGDAAAAVNLPVAGQHNIANAVAAAALVFSAGFRLAEIAAGLAQFHNIKGRLQLKTSYLGARVLDDTYNANPDSMKAALAVLARFEAPRVFVMGDIGELGDNAPALHAEVGAYAREAGIEQALFLGEHSRRAQQAYGGGRHCADWAELYRALADIHCAEATILVKGSRFMQMERAVEALMQRDQTRPPQ